MQLGMIGLGRMGANLVRRLMSDGHECVVHDVHADAIAGLEGEGARGAASLPALVEAMATPRHIWVMVPAAVVGGVVDQLAPLLDAGDVIIDGGNSYYREDIDRAAALAPSGVQYVDVGTSGGVHGLERGFCLMVGGEDDTIAGLAPVFESLAPGIDSAERTRGRTGAPAPGEAGWLHCGPNGAGHFVKMVHNGIEYGAMAALAEGLAVLDRADLGTEDRQADAETAPLRDPEAYRYDLDLASIVEVWRRGSVVSSWLVDLTAAALAADPALDEFDGRVSDSGEGRWTVQTAVELGVPAHTITAALYERFASRDNAEFAGKALSAMRKEFGGHPEKPADPSGSEAGS
ncbi:MAG: phosphogluconate dehydrogenase (NAD(+)-dependent, decarboxylating) [Acidimicrobiales bacterium]